MEIYANRVKHVAAVIDQIYSRDREVFPFSSFTFFLQPTFLFLFFLSVILEAKALPGVLMKSGDGGEATFRWKKMLIQEWQVRRISLDGSRNKYGVGDGNHQRVKRDIRYAFLTFRFFRFSQNFITFFISFRCNVAITVTESLHMKLIDHFLMSVSNLSTKNMKHYMRN